MLENPPLFIFASEGDAILCDQKDGTLKVPPETKVVFHKELYDALRLALEADEDERRNSPIV